jgi:murein DD-endopeptidase MepM/ murein hydrolase activator NlpD
MVRRSHRHPPRISVGVVWLAAGALIATPAAEPVGTALARAPGGPWRPPLSSMSMVAGFDPPAQVWLAGHRGVDLSATNAEEVRAAGAGVVTFAGPVADRPVVVVDHGTLRTTYEPVVAEVSVGERVSAGQRIGAIGEGAHCSGRCLHWGARIGEVYVDPMALLRSYRPVLKTPR